MAELLRVDVSRLSRRAAALAAQPRRLAATLVLSLLLASTAVLAPLELRRIRNDIDAARSYTELERRAGGARTLGVDPELLVRLEGAIPSGSRFDVITGPDVDPPSPLTLDGIRQLAAYWLLPRRWVAERASPEWIVSYGGRVESLGLTYGSVVEVAPGVRVAEVRR